MKTAASIGHIALVGEASPDVKAHTAIPRALTLAGESLGATMTTTWLPTSKLEDDAGLALLGFQGIWCVPGSPYASMEGALKAIRFAREHAIPFLGTCGGFQHALFEHCRNVLGLTKADHTESNADAGLPIIASGRNRLEPPYVGCYAVHGQHPPQHAPHLVNEQLENGDRFEACPTVAAVWLPTRNLSPPVAAQRNL